jgi:hypothetical protein
MRQIHSLAGLWQFQLDPQGQLKAADLAPDREIQVPLPWQAAFGELENYSGFAWYRRNFEVEPGWLAGEILLHFGAVDYWCEVFVNGQPAGQHEGGYTPFTLEVGKLCRAGQNEITVRVYDSAQTGINIPRWPEYPAGPESSQPPFDARNVPHGKQEWYLNAGGIWQDVQLIAVPPRYLAGLHLTPDFQSGQVSCKVELAGQLPAGTAALLRLIITDNAGKVEAETTLQVEAGRTEYQASLTVKDRRDWNLDQPYLYSLTASLEAGAPIDRLTSRFGFREIQTREGKLWLNSRPLYLLSALDQDIYDETIYTVPSEEYLRDQFRKAKELGLNCLRCHIKPPDPRYLDLADEMGLLVWAEIPSWRTFYPRGTIHPNQLRLDDTIKQRVAMTLEEMVRRDYNHPSLIIWTIVNEDWGTSLALSASDRQWVGQMYNRCKELDPTRLVVDNSACPQAWGPNIHVQSDLDDFHVYTNIPDQADRWEQTLEQYNLRPLWTYSSHSDTVRSGQEPLILSEFGNWGMPLLENLSQTPGQEPDWFKLGPWWSGWEGEPGWPHGVAGRFDSLGLAKIWPDYAAFATATQWHEYRALKFEIEVMRRLPNLQGYVITELADIYWESNGLLDFRRNPKAFHTQFAAFNSPDVIVPKTSRRAFWDTESVVTDWYASHYSGQDWQGATFSGSGPASPTSLPVGEIAPGEVKRLGRLTSRLAPVERPTLVRLESRLESGQGRKLAENYLEALVLPRQSGLARFKGAVAVVTGPAEIEEIAGDPVATGNPTISPEAPGGRPVALGAEPAEAVAGGNNFMGSLEMLGYRTSSRLTSDTELIITNFPDAEMLQRVRQGGKMLFLAQNASPFFWVQGRGGAYSGGWITSFSWLRPDVHTRLDFEGLNPLSLPFSKVMPSSTILGLPIEDPAVREDILAGMISGWLQHPAAHTVQFCYGAGKVIMTTFGLLQAVQNHRDPVGIAMLNDLVDYLVSERCQPNLKANY